MTLTTDLTAKLTSVRSQSTGPASTRPIFNDAEEIFRFDRIVSEILGGKANLDLKVQNLKSGKILWHAQCSIYHWNQPKSLFINDCNDFSRREYVQYWQIIFFSANMKVHFINFFDKLRILQTLQYFILHVELLGSFDC